MKVGYYDDCGVTNAEVDEWFKANYPHSINFTKQQVWCMLVEEKARKASTE